MRSSLRLGGVALLLIAAGLVARPDGCSDRHRNTGTRLEPNVLFIAVDTLRADRLGCQGNARGLTPNLDILAKGGARFEKAFSHAPWTLPSFASLFTSLPPEQHGAGGNLVHGFRALAESAETLAERFRASGYATHGVVNVDFLAEKFGLTQGFEDVDAHFSDDNRDMRDAQSTTDAAARWLAEHREPSFFLFVHYFDPHAEYRPPQPFRREFAAPEDRQSEAFEFGRRDQVVAVRNGLLKITAEDMSRAEKLYDGEVAYTDAQIGRLLAEMRRLGLEDNTLVVLTADHGEEFLDHGGWEHGHSLYDELLHVPLILSQPGRIEPRVITEPVAHVDVAPSLCALCRVPPARSFTGRDLAPALRGQPLAPRASLAYGNFWGEPLRSIRDADYTLILRPASLGAPAKSELYRWKQDARESDDLAAAEPGVVARLGADLALLEKSMVARGTGTSVRPTLSQEERERLKRLGYIDGEEKE